MSIGTSADYGREKGSDPRRSPQFPTVPSGRFNVGDTTAGYVGTVEDIDGDHLQVSGEANNGTKPLQPKISASASKLRSMVGRKFAFYPGVGGHTAVEYSHEKHLHLPGASFGGGEE